MLIYAFITGTLSIAILFYSYFLRGMQFSLKDLGVSSFILTGAVSSILFIASGNVLFLLFMIFACISIGYLFLTIGGMFSGEGGSTPSIGVILTILITLGLAITCLIFGISHYKTAHNDGLPTKKTSMTFFIKQNHLYIR
jgi:hypothetical protein